MTAPATVSAPRRVGPLVAVLALLVAPAVLAGAEALAFRARNRPSGTMVSSGERREYRLHVPASYQRGRPTALVVSMHGGGLWAAAQETASQWNRVADRHGFIVVYPSADGSDGPRAWHASPGEIARDVRFITELIDTLRTRYDIDSTRIYADGLSNGGGMAFVLSCTVPDRIAAVGLVASAQLVPWRWCPDRRPVPMMAIHGTADDFAPYEGGGSRRMRITFPDIATWVEHWARRNGCRPEPLASQPAADVTRLEYAGCTSDASVVHFRLLGTGHVWPGGEGQPASWLGTMPGGFDAASELWAFYERHRLTTRR